MLDGWMEQLQETDSQCWSLTYITSLHRFWTRTIMTLPPVHEDRDGRKPSGGGSV